MIGIIDFGSSKVPFIEKAVDEYMDFETIHHEEFTPEFLKKYKGIILSGAPRLITEVDERKADLLYKTQFLANLYLLSFGFQRRHEQDLSTDDRNKSPKLVKLFPSAKKTL